MDFTAIWANTPLALVNDFLLKGEVAPPPDGPVGENEEVIGELTPLEKAIYSAKYHVAESNNTMAKDAVSKGEKPDMLQIKQNHVAHKTLDSLFWACIRQRLGAATFEKDGVGIRKDYKIVCYSNDMSSLFPGSFLAGLAESIAEHNCGECADYDECDLPQKKPR
ncbi:MAG: hypothetical protein A3J76_02955 [Candidatus Moranbacteria bacterium RBG_13_45_13]|nr:MAG: hypothetical protein A3J76_02955 [Candidatus Moranbacteria bacterium RBG_13_45_13]